MKTERLMWWLAIASAVAAMGCESGKERTRAKATEVAAPTARPAPADAASGPVISARSPDLPLPDQIMDRFDQAIGGREANREVTSLRIVARIHGRSSSKLSGRTESLLQAPDKFLRRDRYPKLGTIERGTDGVVAWEKNPRGIRLLGGAEKAALQRAPAVFGRISLRDAGFTRIETIGIAEVDGRPAYDIKLTTTEKTVDHYFFDQESGLLVRVDQRYRTPIGIFKAHLYPSDFREVHGVMFPFHTISKLGKGMVQEYEVEKIEVNSKLPEDAFAVPEDVQALVDAHQKPEPAGGE